MSMTFIRLQYWWIVIMYCNKKWKSAHDGIARSLSNLHTEADPNCIVLWSHLLLRKTVGYGTSGLHVALFQYLLSFLYDFGIGCMCSTCYHNCVYPKSVHVTATDVCTALSFQSWIVTVHGDCWFMCCRNILSYLLTLTDFMSAMCMSRFDDIWRFSSECPAEFCRQ